MALIKDGQFSEDVWVRVADEESLSEETRAVVSLSRWKEEKANLLQRNAPLGIRLEPGENPESISEDVNAFSLIEVSFPAFKDGRGYSYARMLRQDYGYEGELRATGNVLRSQLSFMHRVGFNAFEVDERITPDVVAKELSRYSHRYQPSVNGGRTVLEERANA